MKNEHAPKPQVAIVGANGYAGLELARLLLMHPYAELKACFVRDETWSLDKELATVKPQAIKAGGLNELIHSAGQFQAVFLATPAEISMELAPQLVPQTKVIDLSGAFRLPAEVFGHYYEAPHLSPELLKQTHYGLMPWNRAPSSSLIANPGCYATSCLMALIPLLKDGLIEPSSIVIDAKSGTSGAGRKAKESLLFSEVDGNCTPYKVGAHQHKPEIEIYLSQFSGVDVSIQFATHLLPVRRGIISSIYLKRHESLAHLSDEGFETRLKGAFEKAYANDPLVRVGSLSESPWLSSLRRVVGTPGTHISYVVKGNSVFVFSCVDNLLKGAASQAVENWNALNDWPTETGLKNLESFV